MSCSTRFCVGALMLVLGAVGPASAQGQYPAKPIRVVVPNPAGGIDQYLRFFQPRMAELLGQPLVIESRPGASGAIVFSAAAIIGWSSTSCA